MNSIRRLRRHAGRRSLSVNLLVPNIVTTLALCSGLTAIRFALQERWELAVIAILVAAVLDGLDGRVARLLRASSSFGAQFDSLSDVIAFGVAPAVVIYLWSTQGLGNVGWVPSLALAVCCALRLARFNSQLEISDRPAWTKLFFTGIPAPAGGALALLPMVATFAVPASAPLVAHPVAVALWCIAIAYLMVSTIPTFAMKGGRIPTRALLPLLMGVGLVAALLLTAPWLTLLGLAVVYLALIPVSARKAGSLRRREPPAASRDGDQQDGDRQDGDRQDENRQDNDRRDADATGRPDPKTAAPPSDPAPPSEIVTFPPPRA